MKHVLSVLSCPRIYQLWQAPFSKMKLGPFFQHNRSNHYSRILEVGCGPGTNVPHLRSLCDSYVGFDISEQYIRYASKKYRNCEFFTGNAISDSSYLQAGSPGVVLINSLMHHLSDEDVLLTLSIVSRLGSTGTRVHVVDLVLPPMNGFPRFLALNDRGRFPRSLDHWKSLLDVSFETEVFQAFSIHFGKVSLWELFYWVGHSRSAEHQEISKPHD